LAADNAVIAIMGNYDAIDTLSMIMACHADDNTIGTY
jgi:hypothetical protein